LRAGDKAAIIYANNEAVSYFQHVLSLLDKRECDPREKARVLERLGDIKGLVGEYDACLKHWDSALQLRKQLQEKEHAARLHRKIASVLWNNLGDTERAKENYDKALEILKSEPESVELASLYQAMAHMNYRTKDVAAAFSWANKALELAKKLNANEVIASSYASLGTVFNFRGELGKARECHERGLKIALDNGYMDTALREYNNLPLTFQPDERGKALEYLEKGYELAKKVGDVHHQSWLGVHLGGLYAGMGKTSEAVKIIGESAALDTKVNNLPNLAFSKWGQGMGCLMLGEWEEAEQLLMEALTIANKLGQFQQIGNTYGALGFLNFNKGDYRKALEFFEKTMTEDDKAGAKHAKMEDSNFLIWTLIELGEIEKAESLLDDLEKFAVEVNDKGLMVNADICRAMLFRAQKKWTESVELFEKSLREFEAMGARQWNVFMFARTVLYEYARVYLERNDEGDREKAHSLLNEALGIFQRIGAKKEVERIIAQKKLLTS
jgi:tetratricopeptide (TPR) repeat protein